jgi:APA family basic amino acid/polyamine antiporter
MVPYYTIDPDTGVSSAFSQAGMHWAEFLISFGALLGMSSVLLVTLMGQPRILLAMSRDGLLPQGFFGAIQPEFKTPHKSTVLTAIFVAILAAFIPLSVLVEMVSIGTLLAFTIVCISIIILRRTQPNIPRPFRCPWVPFVPGCGAFLCIMLMLSLPGSNWIRLVVWLAIGLAIYFGWSRKNAAFLRARTSEDEEGVALATFNSDVTDLHNEIESDRYEEDDHRSDALLYEQNEVPLH